MSNVREEFLFLNELRRDGSINMFGASPYLAEVFDLTQKEASAILVEWMGWVKAKPSNRDF
jgi:hypothetical protein